MKVNIRNLESDLVESDAVVDNTFIDQDLIEYYRGPVKVHLILDKFGRNYRIDIDLSTEAQYVCDRCLSEYSITFKAKQRLIVQLGGMADNEDEQDIIFLPENTTEIDISPYLKEMVLLNHPLKMLCQEECRGICPRCGADLNTGVCMCPEQPVDPKWDALRKLIK
jgi:uncharacterized protein